MNALELSERARSAQVPGERKLLDTSLRVPRGKREHERGAGRDEQRLGGDAEGNRVLRAHTRGDQDVEEALREERQLPGHRQPHPHVVSDFSPDRGSTRSEMTPRAFVISLGITQTLFASPCAICGRT